MTEDFAAKAAVIHVLTTDVSADNDNVIRSGDIKAGIKAQGCIGDASGVVNERIVTTCRVGAGDVVIERTRTNSRIVGAGCVYLQRIETDGCVVDAGSVE